MPQFIPQHTPEELDAFTRGYLEAAEWLLPEEDLEKELQGFSPEAIAEAKADCAKFQTACADVLALFYEKTGKEGDSGGHDFYLTRNHHGAGFWDRGAGEIGTALTDAAHFFGEKQACVGDDNKIYFE